MTTEYQAFLLRTLRGGLEEVSALVRAFPGSAADRDWIRDAWPVRQHINHLRQIEGRYLQRLELTLEGSDRIPPPVEQAPPAPDEPMESILDGYLDAGWRALAVFEGLTPEQWATRFVHPTIWGEVSVEWWAERFAQHTAEHIDELWMMKQLSGMTDAAYAEFAKREKG